MKHEPQKKKNPKKEKWEKIIERKKFFYILIFLNILVLSMSYSFIGWNERFLSLESNYNQRVAQEINFKDTNFLNEQINDNYSINKVPLHINVYTIVLALFNNLPTYILKIFNILLSTIALVLFFLFLRENKVSKIISNLSVLIVIISPIFIYYGTSLSGLSLFTILLITSLLSIKRDYKLLTIIITILIPFFGIQFSLFYLTFIFAYSIHQNKIKSFYTLLSIIIGWSLILYYLVYNFTTYNFVYPSTYHLVREVISEFGGIRGISIMTISILIIGFFKYIIERKQLLLNLLFLIGTFVLLILDYRFFYLLNFAIAFYASTGLVYIIKRKWFSQDLKNLTVILILCGLVFTLLSFTGRISEINPTEEHIASLQWLNEQEKGIVFTFPKFSSYVQNIAGMPVIIDYFSTNLEIKDDFNSIYTSQDLINTAELLEKYNVKYIYLDNEMKNIQWFGENEGLLFVLSDPDYFEKIYDDGNSEIWRVSNLNLN